MLPLIHAPLVYDTRKIKTSNGTKIRSMKKYLQKYTCINQFSTLGYYRKEYVQELYKIACAKEKYEKKYHIRVIITYSEV